MGIASLYPSYKICINNSLSDGLGEAIPITSASLHHRDRDDIRRSDGFRFALPILRAATCGHSGQSG
jgi:hypothetical protein